MATREELERALRVATARHSRAHRVEKLARDLLDVAEQETNAAGVEFVAARAALDACSRETPETEVGDGNA